MKKILSGLCLYLMVVMQITAFGAVLPRNTRAAAPPRRPIIPILECVADLGGGNYSARFGYNNQNQGVETIGIGANNGFNPTPIDRGQPTNFLTGLRSNVFSVAFNGSPITWTVRGPDNVARSVTASSSSTSCGVPTPTPTPTVTPTPTPTPTPGSCVPGTFSFGNGQQQTSGSPNVRTASVNGITLSTKAFARPRAGISPETNFTPSFVSNQKPGYGVTNPGEGTGGGDLQKIDNTDNQSPAQIDYIVQYSSIPVVFDRAVLEKVGADSDVRIWIGNVAALPASINQAFLDTLYTEYLPDGGGPTRTINFNAGNLAGNLFIIAPSPSGVNDSFNFKSLSYTCPPTGPVNTTPDAVNDSATVVEDSGATSLDVLGNDTDADGNPLTITAVTQPSGSAGTVVNNGNNVTFTPATNFAGTTTFTYNISDGQGGSDTATVNVTVTPVNDAPVAIGDSYSTSEDTVLNVAAPGVLGNDMDVDGPSLSAVLVSGPSNGTLTLNSNGSFSYSPNANFSGTDTFVYQATDGIALSGPATVTITVTPVNDPPDAVNDSATVDEDGTNNAINVLANDSDDDGGTLSVTAATNGSNGTVTFTATGVSYTPNTNFSGSDAFTYTISDGQGGNDTATVNVAVTGANDAPDAVNDAATVNEDSGANAINVLANDTDADGDTLSVTAVTQGANGSVTFIATGVSYTPNTDFSGSDSFTYTISDGNGGTDTATVNVTVAGVNDAPDAVNDSATVAEDSGANPINVLANDSDSDGGTLSVTAVTNGSNGTVTFIATGVSYMPNANFNGTDSFTYTISDGQGGSDTATVAVTVTAVNDAPDAVNDSATVSENSTNNPINVLGNDTDVDGDSLSVTAVTQPANGSAAFTATGVSYTPNANFSGTDTFTYTISDGNGGSDTATVTVTVTGVNQAPDAVDDSATVAEDSGANAINVLANDTDGDGDTLTVTAVTQAANGSVAFTATGVSYTPNANFNGSDSFTYTISDGNGGSDTATVNVTVTAVNDPPVAVDDSGFTTIEDNLLNIPSATLLSNDNNGGDGGPLTLQSVSPTSTNGGTVAIVGSNVRYTPALNFTGSDTFTYAISDGTDTATATVSLTVTDVPEVGVNLLLNEVEIDPPNPTSFACQYIELRGAPGYTAPAEAKFVSVNGVAGNFGDVFLIANLGGVTVGSNGTITIVNDVELCPSRTFPAGTTIVSVTNFSGLGEGAKTFAVVSTANALAEGTDIDVNNDRTIDPNFNLTVVDGIAITTNQVLEAAYAPIVYDSATQNPNPGDLDLPDAATRFLGDTTPLSAAAWYYGDLASSPDDSTVYEGTPQSSNFPVGGRLTPGDQNTLFVANQPPDALDDTATVAEDSTNNVIDVLANDTDPDGGTLTITAATNGTNGTVVNNGTNVSYTPNANFNGTDTFTYTIADGQGGSDTATVMVTVGGVNDAPDAVNDSATVAEDSTNNIINVLANDTDGDGDTLTITAATNGSNGTVVNNGTNVAYTPNPNFVGNDSFTYTISDGNGGSDTATVSVSVGGTNDAPDAVNDSATVAEDSGANAVNVLANDTDGDGDALTVTAVTQGANGSVTFTASGVSYTPNANFNGSDSFTYTISDGNGGSDTATVSVTVANVNDAPDAINDSASVAEDSTNNIINVLANDVDIDGDSLTITAATNGANGTVVNNGTNVSYTPNANFTGTDSFTYTISDGNGGTDTATVNVTVGGTNDAPDAVNDSATVAEDSGANPVNVLANDTDPDGDSLSVTAATNGANGSVTFTATGVSYTPNANFNGSDSFTYTISDGNGGTDTATVTVTVTGVNDAPDAVNDSGSVAEDSTNNAINVLANDTDIDGNPLTVTAATQGANGSVMFTASGVSYTPNANFVGSDSFTYTISDGQGGTDSATVNVTVGGTNDPPDAVNDSATVAEDSGANAINVLANDTDLDGDSLSVTAVTQGANGSVTFTATGVSYTPNANFSGSDSFTYTISDGNGGTDTATVAVTVTGVNDAPDAVNDSATVAEDSGANAINVLANDTDPEGNTLSVTAVTQGANGSVTFAATGVSYTPNANFNGSDSFTYTISDGNGGTDTATVAVTVTNVNDGPDAVNDSATVTEDSGANAINVLANDTDPEGNTLSVTAVTQGTNGSVTFTATGVSYTPNANFNGSDSFTYTISDGNGGTDTATVNVTVTAVNDNPDAVNDAPTVAEDSGANPINVLANDTDIDGDSLTVTSVTQGTNGSVTFTATGVSYTPNAGFSGTDNFTYTISDGNGGSDTATVTVTVSNVNDNPDAVNDSATVAEDSAANAIDVLANDTDGDGDTLTVTAVTQGANGSVTFTATGVSYTPNANFNGSDSFTYTISDGNGGSDTATVSVTVTAVNDAPDAVNDSATVAEDTTNNVINVLANDTDIDAGQTLAVSAVTQGTNGSVVNNGTNVSYTPAPNFFGTDTFTYTISDGNGGTDTATVTVTVTDVPDVIVNLLVNEVEADAPDASNQFACQYVELRGAPGYVVPDGAYFASINGASGSFGDLQFIVPLGGVTVGPNGTITIINQLEGTCPGRTFPADTTLIAIDDFDGLGLQDSGARTFAIFTSPTAPPTDIDTDNNRVIDPALGITIVDGFGFTTNVTFQTTYAPNLYDSASQAGNTLLPDAATRFLGDTTPMTAAAWYFGELASSPASTTVYSGAPQSTNFPTGGRLTPGAPNTLTPVNQPPDAVNDSATVNEDSGANPINVLVNDTDANGDTLTVTAVTQGANGSVTFTATGVSYTPNANFSGADSFTYTINDGNGGTDTATVAVTVTPVNDPPVANSDTATVDEDTTNNAINVLANDNDGGDGGPLSVTAVTQPANGTVTFTAGGVSYTPTANFFGTDTFTYTVSDGGATAVGTVTVIVNDVPEGPTVDLIVNEVEADAPDAATQFPCQYVELRGAPGYVVPAGAYFASINGASGSFGDLQFLVSLEGVTVGANGTITIINQLEGTCPGRTFPADTTLIAIDDFDGLGLQDSGARTFAIFTSPTAPPTDIDTDNNRVIDPALGITIVDGFGFTTNVTFQTTYAPNLYDAASVAANTLLPDAATRLSGNTTPMTAAAWYFGELASSPASTTVYSGAPQTTPFPAGGALTPGAQNVP